MNCDYTFLKAINTFKDCLQTVGTLCREGTKQKILFVITLSVLTKLNSCLVFCEIFSEVSVLRDAEHNFVYFFYL